MGQPGDITTYHWDFGDGHTSSLAMPDHTFDSAGTYQICLIVSGVNNCHDTVCKSLTIFTPAIYYADYTYSHDSMNGNGIHFTNTSVGNANYYTWLFGDGTGSYDVNPYHVYWHAGVYHVNLMAENPNFCWDYYEGDVFVFGNDTCQALFYSTIDTSLGGLTVQFNDTSVGSPISYVWNFGDGQFATQANPSHTFNDFGLYLVCLTTTTATGCQSTWCDSLYIQNTHYYNRFADGNYLNHSFWGSALNGVAPYTYHWNFGDGVIDSVSNCTHLYVAEGAYVVSLTTIDANGSVYISTRTILVGPAEVQLSGQVTAGGASLDAGTISLYYQNPVDNSYVLYYTWNVNSNGSFTVGGSLPQGTYYLYAKPGCYSAFFDTYSPTYDQSSLFWGSATPIVIGTPDSAYNINLVPILGPIPGNGSISGTLTQGLKMTNSGNGIPNVEIMLFNMNYEVIAVVYSDAFGKFSFNNLANGTYLVYAEVAGIPTVPAIITLSDANPLVNNLVLVKTPSGIIGIDENPVIKDFVVLGIYPNPVRESFSLSLESAYPMQLSAEITDLSGKDVMSRQLNIAQGKSTNQINVSSLNPGLYFLTLTTEKGVKTLEKLSLVR